MAYLKIAVREPEGEYYPKALADSVHLYYSEDGSSFEPLNQNYGILFARAQIRENNTLEVRGLTDPVFVELEGGYGIAAECVDGAGNRVAPDQVLLWTTEDFIRFREHGLVERKPWNCFRVLEISRELGEEIRRTWTPLHAVSVKLPDEIRISSWEELEQIRARVCYSDGSADEKRICWSRDSAVQEQDGIWRLEGRVDRPAFRFPLAGGYADPVVFRWQGAWYFVSTDDNRNDIGIRVRKADRVEGLFAEDVKEYCILDRDESRDLIQTFWAPEFHVIGGAVYLLFAVGGKVWSPQAHMMKLKEGGSIICREDWEEPVRVRRKDGGFLAEDGITLDMTYFSAAGKPWLVWSYRRGIGTKEDTGSMLYIAPADDERPWQLAGEPVLLSRPLYAWENQGGTINNEGPYALVLEDRVWLAFSGGDACGWSYAVGYLTADVGTDLSDPANWRKTPTPALSHYSVEETLGAGHNSFFRDEEGKIWIAYHGQKRDGSWGRCTAMHRVQINKAGFPVLNLCAERDLPEHMRRVEIKVCCPCPPDGNIET